MTVEEDNCTKILFILIITNFKILDLNLTCLNKKNLIKELNLGGIETNEKEN